MPDRLDTLDYRRNPDSDWDKRVPTRQELRDDLRWLAIAAFSDLARCTGKQGFVGLALIVIATMIAYGPPSLR